MKKNLCILLAVLMLTLFAFNSFAIAATIAPSETTVITQSLVDKANKGDRDAINSINEYYADLLDKASNSDANAIQKLQNLDCFDDAKVSATLPKNLKVKPGETIKYYLNDGSAISFSSSKTVKKNGVTDTAIYSGTKSWWFGPCYASLRIYIDNSGSTRYVAHIASAWGDVSSLACTMSDPSVSILVNNGNPSYVAGSSVVYMPYGLGSKSVYAKFRVDTTGIMTLAYSVP